MKFWGPAIAWMGIIFIFSSRPSVDVSGSGILNFLFFKSLHLIEYAILFILYYRPLRSYPLAFLLTILYAITDEIHQTLVPTREGRPRDVIIDAIGAAASWYLIVQLLPKAPKKLRTLAKSWHVL